MLNIYQNGRLLVNWTQIIHKNFLFAINLWVRVVRPIGKKVAVVTGSSSGIGYATSLMLARKGFYYQAYTLPSQIPGEDDLVLLLLLLVSNF